VAQVAQSAGRREARPGQQIEARHGGDERADRWGRRDRGRSERGVGAGLMRGDGGERATRSAAER